MSGQRFDGVPEGYRIGKPIRQTATRTDDGRSACTVLYELVPIEPEMEIAIVLPVNQCGADFPNERIDTLLTFGVSRELANLLCLQYPERVTLRKKEGFASQ